MKNDIYYKRIVDSILDSKLRTFGAVNIVGPKWCGKTFTALQHANSSIFFQGISNESNLIYTAKISPSILLEGEKPRLIDEWQDAPEIWDAVRIYCDNNKEKGNFILTGSTSNAKKTRHTGTVRISTLVMHPMSL